MDVDEQGQAGRPARIVFWAGSFERAGTQRFLVELLKRMDRRRFDPTVFSLRSRGELLSEIKRQGIPVYEFGTGRGILSAETWRGLSGATAQLRRDRVDILSCVLGITTLFGPVVGRLAGVPVVVNNQRNLAYRRMGRFEEAFYRFVNRRLVDAVLVNSESARRELLTRFAVPSAKVVRTGVGIDLAPFADAPRDESLASELGLSGHAVVGIVGKLSAVKGHQHFLAAAALIARSHDAVRFLIVGDGPRRIELEQQAAELGIAEATRFVGAREDVPALLKLMDVFVLSSLSEGAPNAIMEAMAAGVPVVATRVGGVPELVADGSTGILVEPRDPVALADAIADLLDDRTRAILMGRSGQSVARERFDIGAAVDEVEQALWALHEAARARTGGRARGVRLDLGNAARDGKAG
jgi:glycosyltransferase involved in cell wall biosynthesis